MHHRRLHSVWLALPAIVAVATTASAQARVSLDVAGLASIHPVDDAYVGSPYLDEGLGGVAPGLLAGASVRVGRRGVVAGEFSQAWLRADLSGRLVRVEFNPPPGFGFSTPPTPVSLADRFLSALAGVEVGGGMYVRVLGGLTWRLDEAHVDGVPVTAPAIAGAEADSPTRLGLAAGLDLGGGTARAVSPYVTVRYAFVDRHGREQELGIGRHVLRAGVGVRIGLGR